MKRAKSGFKIKKYENTRHGHLWCIHSSDDQKREYLHNDLIVREGAWVNTKTNAWYKTRKEARDTVAKYLEKPE